MNIIWCISFICAVAHQSLGQALIKSNFEAQTQTDKYLKVAGMAENLVKKGFTAGDGYGEVWIRDFNTFIDLSCTVNDQAGIRKHLLIFLQFQQPDGGILDGYIPASKAHVGYDFYKSALAPDYLGHKNTVETDQESSLIQAVRKYITRTGDKAILKERVDSLTVLQRLESSMEFLLSKRFDKTHGLIWGATTVDWGDVQPEHPWGVVLDEKSHRAIDIYDNAMFLIAVNDFLGFDGLTATQKSKWRSVAQSIKTNVRKHLWDSKAQKFIPHIYLNGSPFDASFNENEIYYHGGTAIAIEAGLLSRKEIKIAYDQMVANVKKANAASIGLTIYPVYPQGSFQNKSMVPYSYQNGGDWTWFGGRMVIELAKAGFKTEAKEALQPMIDRVIANSGFYEWYTPANQPKGSASFRGEAGVLWSAIERLNK